MRSIENYRNFNISNHSCFYFISHDENRREHFWEAVGFPMMVDYRKFPRGGSEALTATRQRRKGGTVSYSLNIA